MAKQSRCPFCKGPITISEEMVDQAVVCTQCNSLIIPALLEMEMNPYAPPFTRPEAATEDFTAMPTGPTSVLQKYRLAFDLLFSHLGLFSALILTVWLPANLLINFLAYQAQDLSNPFISFRLNSLIEGLFGPVYVAGMIDTLSRLARGQAVTYPEAIAAGFRNWGRLFGTRFLSGLLIMLGLVTFLVPGIVLMVRYALIDQVVVLEGRSGSAARRRSTMLARGKAGQIVAAGLSFVLITLSAGFGAALLLETLEPINNMWTSTVLDCCVQLISPIIIIVNFLIYWESAYLAEAERFEPGTVRVAEGS